MSAARYVVRLRDTGQYLFAEDGRCPQWFYPRSEARTFPTATGAREWLADLLTRYPGKMYIYEDGRVVRLLTHAEAKRKAAASALRLHAVRCRAEAAIWLPMHSVSALNRADAKGIARGYEKSAEDAERAADKLWRRRSK